MSIAQKYGQLAEKREKIEHIDFENDPVILESIELLTKNINETIEFLDNDCTGNQFVWMSEIFEEIAQKTQNREFIQCLYRTADRFPAETKEYNIISFIKFAEEFIV
jgi:hypothetical protein